MKSELKFLLGNERQRIDFQDPQGPQPTTTVLNYLRSLPSFKGTKEGCAEGDCGACTVVLGEMDDEGSLRYKAVDSCLVFLPMLHGKQLLTVEHLRNEQGELHPVQQAMVDTHGSQCGYCTPGFVMSLFSLYKNHHQPTRGEIDDALTGNLCRCTGYRPIVEAAARSCANESVDRFNRLEPQTASHLRSISNKSIQLKTKRQEYFRPASLAEALDLKRELSNATVINGATDVALRVTKRHELIPKILDLGAVPELRVLNDTNGELVLGAGLSLERLRAEVKKDFPALYDMLSVFGSQQIRSLATLGGNLATASPIGDTSPVLIAYNARVILQSPSGRREVAMDNFITGYRQTACKSDELITAVVLPKIGDSVVVKSYKVSKRKDMDISTVSGGFRIKTVDSGTVNSGRVESRTVIGGVVESAKFVFGGMAERTKRAVKTEAFLVGKPWSRDIVEQAMEILAMEFTPIADARSGAEFRRIAAKNLLLKFYTETTAPL